LEDRKDRGKEKGNHQLYELVRAKGTAVKGNQGETNRRDVDFDCDYLEKDGDTTRDSRPLLGKVFAGWGHTVARRCRRQREDMLKVGV